MRPSRPSSLKTISLALLLPFACLGAAPDYSEVDRIFAKHCLECHSTKDPDGGLVMDAHVALMKGGETGVAVIAGNSKDSLLIRAVEGRWEKGGKVKIMPPGKNAKLSPSEIDVLKNWIDAGALPPAHTAVREIVAPKITPKTPPPRSIQSMAHHQGPPGLQRLALARHGEVELARLHSGVTNFLLTGHRGKVNAVAFAKDGKHLVSAGGQPGAVGELKIWKLPEGDLVHSIRAHRDALYCVDVSPDGKTVATGSYDQDIKLWSVETGTEVATLRGHNGAVFDLAFRPDGKVLASASGDRTVKLWEIPSGKRLDTLSQPTKEQHTLAWSSSGGRLFAGGADNRIRVWRISPQALETQNPILESRFAHEGALLNLALSPDGTLLASSAEDRTVKIWNAADLTEKISLPQQPDLSPALVFASAGRELVVGRLDGSLGHYDTSTGGNFTPAKPELTKLLPRGIQRGSDVLVELTGKNLEGVASLRIGHPGIKTVVVKPRGHDKISVKLKVEPSTPRGSYSLTAMGPGGESGELKIWVDDLPNFQEDPDANTFQAGALPGSLWGALEKPGDSDVIELTAAVGEMMVFDIASREIGSKLNPLLELYDPEGRLVAQETAFDGGDPLLAVKAAVAGKHRLVIKDDTLSGSPDHSYRIAFGPLRFVTSAFPLTLGANTEARIKLVGLNLPDTAEITLKAGEPGRQTLALDPELYRWRKLPEVEITSEPVTVEREPNDSPDTAGNIALPGSASGRLWSEAKPGSEDADYYSFRAKAGERVIIETVAAQRGSPADTKIEVLDSMGKPVPRLLLQAVRNTAVNFRSAEANALGMRLDHYEEMELNEYLYLNGDVMKLFRMPQGPDSEMLMYSRGGKRRAFLDTTATAHPLDETGFIVSPKPLGTKLPNNGLPVFTLFYANDDDGDRTAGSDSRLFFTAPTEGDYRIRVTESLRSGSPRHFYTLRLRHPDPGFTATLEGANPVIAAGSGQTFTVRASRRDGFEGPIRVTLTGLPAGFESASPLLIEAGHDSVTSVITAGSTAVRPSEADCARIQLTAQADVEGGFVSMNVGSFGTLRLADSKPKLLVTLEAYAGQDTASPSRSESPMEITIAPGQMVPAWLSIQRNGHQDVVTFEVNNLPHGVIVDNLGLNGITFLKEENARQVFLTASKWVEKQDRPFYAVESQAGRQTSRPIMLKVRPTAGETAAR